MNILLSCQCVAMCKANGGASYAWLATPSHLPHPAPLNRTGLQHSRLVKCCKKKKKTFWTNVLGRVWASILFGSHLRIGKNVFMASCSLRPKQMKLTMTMTMKLKRK